MVIKNSILGLNISDYSNPLQFLGMEPLKVLEQSDTKQ